MSSVLGPVNTNWGWRPGPGNTSNWNCVYSKIKNARYLEILDITSQVPNSYFFQ